MKVTFIDQTMQDFKAFTGQHTFVWNAPGLNFIKGANHVGKALDANGASKSSIFDAWSWCLFGRTPDGAQNPGVLPWYGAIGPTQVQIRVNIDGREHAIERHIGPNRILWDEADIDQHKLINKLKINFSLATHTILLAQGRPLFFEMTPESKMDLFADALELERWDERSDLANRKLLDTSQRITQIEKEIENCQGYLASVNDNIKATKFLVEEWRAAHRQEARDIDHEIEALIKRRDKKQEVLDAAKLQEDGLSTEIRALEKEAVKIQRELAKAQFDVEKAAERVKEAVRKINEAKNEFNKKSKVCPTCGQALKAEHLKQVKNAFDALVASEQAIIEHGVPQQLSLAVTTLEIRLDKHEDFHKEFCVKRDAAQATIDVVLPELERIKAELNILRKSKEAPKENPHQKALEALQESLREGNNELAALTKDHSIALQQADRYTFWRRGFKEIKLQLIEEVLDELEITTNSMLEDVGLSGWEVHYDIEKENKSGTVKRAVHVEIRSPESKGFVKWHSWSGGEQQRLKIAGALALSDVLLARAGIETNIEILDEPATYWSAAGVQDLCGFLSDRARQLKRSIYYIEHQAAESAHFSRVLTVIKDKKGAYIVEE